MALNRPQPEEGSTDDYGLESNTTSTDELEADLRRGAGEMMVIRTLRRFMAPIFVPMFRPLIRQIVEERIGLVEPEFLASMKENLANKASSSFPKKLKLQFKNSISLPVYTGKPLLGENKTIIQIALIDAINEQVVNTGPESMAKLEIIGFRVGEDEKTDDSWTFEKFQKTITSEKKGKRTLQGETCLQLKEGVCFVSRLSFTHNSENTRNGFYKLAAGVIDAGFMNQVEIATTEAFLMKDGRALYSEKHPHPCLNDKVCHLTHIRYKGPRYKRLEEAEVFTVKDLLICLYKYPKKLQHILELKATSKIWDEIVKNAQASYGLFVYLDPNKEQKNGVVLNVKLELEGLIVEPFRYLPVNELSNKQKVDSWNLVKFASEHLEMLDDFKDEISLKESLQLGTGFTSLPSTNRSKKGKEIVSLDDEMISYRPPTMETPNGLHFEPPEAGTFDFFHESPVNSEEMHQLINEVSAILCESLHNECNSTCSNSDPGVVGLAAQTARTRWINVYKLLRRKSIKERFRLLEGIQPLKKQRCF